jgi:enoyl-CoA hydratase/carnithine racemase
MPVADVAGDQALKALVVRGEGRAFCAGADLLYFESAFRQPDQLSAYLQRLNGCLFQLEGLPFPTIAVVHGYALAGGLELMLACDLSLAAEDARLGDQHANFGLMPGGGSTQRLPRRIGMMRAMELLTTGRWLSGAEAAAWGLVLRAVPAAALDAELERLVAPLRDKSRPGLGWIKSVARRGQDLPLRDGIALERQAFAQYVATSPHPAEGIQAFKEKRQPRF